MPCILILSTNIMIITEVLLIHMRHISTVWIIPLWIRVKHNNKVYLVFDIKIVIYIFFCCNVAL